MIITYSHFIVLLNLNSIWHIVLRRNSLFVKFVNIVMAYLIIYITDCKHWNTFSGISYMKSILCYDFSHSASTTGIWSQIWKQEFSSRSHLLLLALKFLLSPDILNLGRGHALPAVSDDPVGSKCTLGNGWILSQDISKHMIGNLCHVIIMFLLFL